MQAVPQRYDAGDEPEKVGVDCERCVLKPRVGEGWGVRLQLAIVYLFPSESPPEFSFSLQPLQLPDAPVW